jgi:hypothetical protein
MRGNTKIVNATGTAMATTELPTTMPAVVESSAQRMAWLREIQNDKDEQGLIDAQIESLRRVNASARDEAERICNARIDAAHRAMEREVEDADKIMEAGTAALRQRYDDLAKMIRGREAAMSATE